jgi:hypothetical protein
MVAGTRRAEGRQSESEWRGSCAWLGVGECRTDAAAVEIRYSDSTS